MVKNDVHYQVRFEAYLVVASNVLGNDFHWRLTPSLVSLGQLQLGCG